MEYYFLWLIPLALMFWAARAYNRLVSLLRLADEGWSGVSVQLKRRNDLVPSLVEVVKGYAGHESALIAEITRLRAGVAQGLDRGVANKSLARCDGALAHSLGRLALLVESYPDLKAGRNFLDLQKSLSELEDALQMSRRYYNGAVRDYKIMRESFPSLLIVRIFGFEDRVFFALADAAEAAAPQIEQI